MHTTTPKIRHTRQQLAILDYLYRFRYGTSDLLSIATSTNKRTINIRLKLMLDHGYIERIYKPEYRLQNKHAIYHLSTNGRKLLRSLDRSDRYNPDVLRTIRDDAKKSEGFISHCLDVFRLYCELKAQHGDGLQFHTKSQLGDQDYFPQPLPDVYIQLPDDEGEPERLFLNVLPEHPFFKATRTVMQYVTFAEEDQYEWKRGIGHDELPSVLLVCENRSLQKRLTKKMQRIAKDAEENDLYFYTTTLEGFGDVDNWQDMTDECD